MDVSSEQSLAREKILETAERLFYQQGYHATGINQIIDEAGVAKATFYSHFPSKEELCIAYLERVRDNEAALVQATLEKKRSAMARYLAPIEVLEPWLIETKFRGCPFLNIASEIPDQASRIRAVGAKFYADHQQLIENAIAELRASDTARYGHLDPSSVAQRYMTIFVGAIGLCEIFHRIDPLKDALRMVKALVD